MAIIGIFKRTVSRSFQFCTDRTVQQERLPDTFVAGYVLECCSTTAEAVETLSDAGHRCRSTFNRKNAAVHAWRPVFSGLMRLGVRRLGLNNERT
jgi:hypothetical protein